MAANHSEVFNLNADLQFFVNVLRSREFYAATKTTYVTEYPAGPGATFRLSHSVSFSSWGEDISITLTPIGLGITRVDIYSECSMPTQFVDWGKNKQMVFSIYEYLRYCVDCYTAQQQAPPTGNQPNGKQGQRAKFCQMCGNPIEQGSRFCSVCGAKLV